MFNATENIFILDSGEALRGAVRNAFDTTVYIEETFYTAGDAPKRPGKPLATFVDRMSAQKTSFGRGFLEDLFAFSQAEGLNNDASLLDHMILVRLFGAEGVNRSSIQFLQRWSRVALLALWKKKSLLLPLRFQVGATLLEPVRKAVLTEVAHLVSRHPDREVCNKGMRLLWCTDWHSFRDLKLGEVGQFHARTLTGSDAPISGVELSRWPWRKMLKYILDSAPKELPFSERDLALYSNWAAGDWYKRYTFTEFCDGQERIRNEAQDKYRKTNQRAYMARREQLHALKNQPIDSIIHPGNNEHIKCGEAERRQSYNSRKAHTMRRKAADRAFGPDVKPKIDYDRPVAYRFLEEIATSNTIDSPERYFLALANLKLGRREPEL